MTNTPGSGWPGSPPPQGPGSNPGWGAPTGNGGQNLQYPGQPQQYPGQPQHYPGQPQPAPSAGFDPQRALGEPPPARVSINEFRPPPNRTPLLITIAALITLVLVIAGGIYVRSLPEQQPSASPSASRTTAGPGHPFTTPNGNQSGRWEILDSTWTDEGLQLELRLYADDGNITFSFLAFANATTEVVAPSHSPESPDIRTGTVTKTQPVTGFVFFPMPRGDATIILANGAGRQMSALAVKG